MLPSDLRAILARADDGAWVTTTAGQILFWNRAAERLLGYRARDVQARSCAELLAPRGAGGDVLVGDGWPLVTPAGFDHGVEVQARTKSGRLVWLDVTAFSAEGARGVPLVIHVFRDVTRRRDLLRQIQARTVAVPDGERLTPREREVLRAMAAGLGTAAAAERLRVSRATIRNHAQNIFGKLGVHTRLQAVVHAARRGLL